jgi:hypothetical protein
VQVAVGAGHFHLVVAEAAQAHLYAGHIVGQDAGIGDENNVGAQLLLVGLNEDAQVIGADFFLALKHKLEVAGYARTAVAQHHFEGLYVHVHLAFVVAGATGVDFLVFDNRLEGRRGPQLVGVGGLHVVVAVHEHGGAVGASHVLAVHDGIAGRGADFDVGSSSFFQLGFQVVGGPQHVAVKFGVGRHRRNPQPVKKFVEKALLVLGKVGRCGHRWKGDKYGTKIAYRA